MKSGGFGTSVSCGNLKECEVGKWETEKIKHRKKGFF